MAAQQDLAFKMIHIESKSINIWVRYDPKQDIYLLVSTLPQSTQT